MVGPHTQRAWFQVKVGQAFPPCPPSPCAPLLWIHRTLEARQAGKAWDLKSCVRGWGWGVRGCPSASGNLYLVCP